VKIYHIADDKVVHKILETGLPPGIIYAFRSFEEFSNWDAAGVILETEIPNDSKMVCPATESPWGICSWETSEAVGSEKINVTGIKWRYQKTAASSQVKDQNTWSELNPGKG
jgi:hypothetical protein